MDYYTIPLSNSPNQSILCPLMVDGVGISLLFWVRFNEVASYWVMDISDGITKLPLLASIPLVPGSGDYRNILSQYAYLRIGSCYLVNVIATTEEWPSESSLGTTWQLWWSDTVYG
jgi:hypothetical protein